MNACWRRFLAPVAEATSDSVLVFSASTVAVPETRKHLGQDLQVLWAELVQARDAQQTHCPLHLVTHDVDGTLSAWLAKSRLGEEERTAEADSLGTQRERLDHIGTASHTSIDPNLKLVEEVRTLLPQVDENVERGPRVVNWGRVMQSG